MRLFSRKPLNQFLEQSADAGKGMRRTLGSLNLIALGIGAIIGAGLFVRTAAAAAEAAGPGVMFSYIVGGIGCMFAGLCYAEFAAMIPIAGSAYAYSYVTMGEFMAWIIGWALILEYALASATVSIAWSEYLNNLTNGAIPYEWSHSPLETSLGGVHGIINLPAIFILTILTLVLIKGTRESAALNGIIVFVKMAIVLAFIVIGWQFIDPANHNPLLIPEGTPGHENWRTFGFGGILGGAGIVFFAFIGFDAVSTAAQEAKDPKRSMPIAILGSLIVCTLLFVLFSYVLTGICNWQEFKVAGKEASVVYAIEHYMPGYHWLGTMVTVAILAGFSSVILVMLMGQSRVFYSMSKDGLLPKVFSDLHSRFRTPYKSNLILLVFGVLFGGLLPGSLAGDLTSFGTLFAFMLVCIGIWIMRVKDPTTHRPFRTPLVPLVPILGALICFALIYSLGEHTLLMAFGWMTLGIIIYFGYGYKHSHLAKNNSK